MRIALALGALLAMFQGHLIAGQSELPKYSFTVEIEGKALGTFRQVSGLGVETEVIEFRDGSDGTTHLFPGNTKYTQVKLTRAFSGNSALWDWYTTSAEGGHVGRFNGVITVYDRSGRAIATYRLINAWPQKYTGPTLNAESSDVPMESIELVHEGLQLTTNGSPR